MGNTTTTGRSLLLALLLALPLFIAADEPRAAADAPKSAKAKAAIKKYDRAVEKAKADYDRAVAAAGKELNGELNLALKAALKAGSLDEANRVEAVVRGLPAKAAGGAAKGGGEPEPKLETPRHVVGAWDLAGADIYLKTNHLALHEEPTLLGVWYVRDGKVSIAWSSGVTDAFPLGDDENATAFTGRNSHGGEFRIVRK